jgi:hypothetical protein
MKNYYVGFALVVIIVAAGLFGLYYYLNLGGITPNIPITERTGLSVTTGPQKGDIGYKEEDTTVVVGTKEISGGTFDRVEGGLIYFDSSGVATSLPLTTDEVAIQCTTQYLANAKELDFDQVTKVVISSPSELGAQIPAAEPVVIFASDVDGVLRAHTIALAAASCPK